MDFNLTTLIRLPSKWSKLFTEYIYWQFPAHFIILAHSLGVLPIYIEVFQLNFKLFGSHEVLEINILSTFNIQNLHKLAILVHLDVTESTHACKCRFVLYYIIWGKNKLLKYFLGRTLNLLQHLKYFAHCCEFLVCVYINSMYATSHYATTCITMIQIKLGKISSFWPFHHPKIAFVQSKNNGWKSPF